MSPAAAAAAIAPWPWFGFFPGFLLIPLLWFALLAVLLVVLIRRRRAWSAGVGRGAEGTLAERFANGDIDEVEYRARLEVLRANREPR